MQVVAKEKNVMQRLYNLLYNLAYNLIWSHQTHSKKLVAINYTISIFIFEFYDIDIILSIVL